MVLDIIPAYGKSYTTSARFLADWQAGKDFRIVNGPYMSIRDSKRLLDQGYDLVRFRDVRHEVNVRIDLAVGTIYDGTTILKPGGSN